MGITPRIGAKFRQPSQRNPDDLRLTPVTPLTEATMTYLPHAFLFATTVLIWASLVTSTLI